MEEIEARMAMRNKDNVASMSAELLELPLASWHEILTVRQTFADTECTMGTNNGSKSKPGAMTEKLGPHLMEFHTGQELAELSGVELVPVQKLVGGLLGAKKLQTEGAKGPNRQYRWNPAAKQAWQKAHPAATADT
jgi:hypothetical protein